MTVKIVNKFNGQLPFDIVKNVNKILSAVPKKYLAGLHSIVLLDKISIKHRKGALGIYIPKSKQHEPHILIDVSKVYSGTPTFLFLFPFFQRFMLAEVIFHEIGHHQHFMNKGVKKKNWEKYADEFKREMRERYYKKTFALFYPIRILKKNLKKK